MNRPVQRSMWCLAGSSVPMLVGLLSVARPAFAQPVDLAPPVEPASAAGASTDVYAGVTPGGSERPAVRAKPGAGRCRVTWPGFQMRPDGSSRVFVQTTRPVTPRIDVRGDEVVVDLGNIGIDGSNNRRPLDTRFFNTPVDRVVVKRQKRRTQIVLELRAAQRPVVSTERADNGFHFVYLDFPAGSYLEAAAQPAPVAESEPTPGHLAPPPAPDEPAPPPSHLSGEVKASGSVETSVGNQLPSKASGEASGSAEGKAGFSF